MNKSSLPILFRAIVITITLITFSVIVYIWQDIKKDRIKDLYYTSSVIKRYYELSFNQWRNTLVSLGERLVQVEGEKKQQRRQAIVDESVKNFDELLAIGLANPEGKIITFSNSEPEDSLPNLMNSPQSKRSFLRAKEHKGLSIGEVYYFPNVKDWILPLRVPIYNKAGDSLLAVNTTALKYDQIVKDLLSFGFDDQYRIHLINDDFNISQIYYPLAHDQYARVLMQPIAMYDDPKAYEIDGVDYVEVYNDLDSMKMWQISVPLAGLNHTLKVSVNQTIIWKDLANIFKLIGVVYFLIVFAIFVLFRYAERRQKQFMDMLVDSESNLKAIIESTNSIIGLFDMDKRLIEFNQAFANYGLMTDGIVLEKGMDVFSMMKNNKIANIFSDFFDRSFKGEKFSKTIAYPGPDGTIYFMLSYNPIYHHHKVIGLSLFVENVTELKTYQKQLEQQTQNQERTIQNRTKQLQVNNEQLELAFKELKEAQQKLVQSEKMASLGVLAAGIGHEINNPLNFIKNGAAALKINLADYKVDISELNPYFEVIDTGVERANKIVKSLSHFSRQVKTMDERCQVNLILENCLNILNNSFRKSITIEKRLGIDCPIILGNEGKLHQAFLNLINNAAQAINEKGIIQITTSFDEKAIIIKIEDDGEGISPENLSQIADPFFTTKDPGEGTGLGLFITYNIIEEHSGSIDVSSTKNKGTIFTIKLPRSNDAELK